MTTRLAPIETGVKEPQLFWGRWESSSWATAPIVAPYAGSRDWGPENLLIFFNQANLVQSWLFLKDKDLLPELTRIHQAPVLDLSAPLRFPARLRYWESPAVAEVTLANDYFEYAATNGFKTDRDNLKSISLTSEVLPSTDPFDKESRPQPDPTHVWVKLKFAKRTAKGKTVTLGLDPPSLLCLVRYVAQSKTASRPSA